ncbi:DUF4407 domain-containing protein [Bartonella machadoae]|uniref:DUF4407 domain-containing protein n=1 Tax=Bartonella machadoae TaxID=2893471 RepID=UPI001F4C5CE3|nr:DUF4407 domain-containing protein [Bartonella machadoae]UNE53778.1 DUF4407 domain-containing protein [Bartonella machadoae]
MKKYSLITLLSLSFISHAIADNTENTEEYYKQALETTETLNAVKSGTAETIHEHATTAAKKIKEINEKLAQLQAKAKVQTQTQEKEQTQTQEQSNLQELQALQIELSALQAELQADALKLQSLDMIQAKNTKTNEEVREENVHKENEDLLEKLKEKLAKSNVSSNLGSLDERF